jgi:hypothetical protein
MNKVKGMVFLLIGLLMLQGCSHETTGDLKELGHDAKRDIEKAARNVDDKVKDAVD